MQNGCIPCKYREYQAAHFPTRCRKTRRRSFHLSDFTTTALLSAGLHGRCNAAGRGNNQRFGGSLGADFGAAALAFLLFFNASSAFVQCTEAATPRFLLRIIRRIEIGIIDDFLPTRNDGSG